MAPTIGTPVKVIDNQTIQEAASTLDAIGTDLSGCINLSIGFELTFSGSATKGATINMYTDPDGASQTFAIGTYHTPTWSMDIDLDAGHKVENGFIVPRVGKYVKFEIVNNDTAQDITGASLWVIPQTA